MDVLLWVESFALIQPLICASGRIVWSVCWGCPAEDLDWRKDCCQWRGHLLLLIFLKGHILLPIFLEESVCNVPAGQAVIYNCFQFMREPYLNVTMILVCYFISWRPSLLRCLGTPLSSFRAGSIFGRGLLYPVNPEPVSNFHVKGSLMSRHYHRPLLRARADKILEWCHKKPSSHLHPMFFFEGSKNGGKCKKILVFFVNQV